LFFHRIQVVEFRDTDAAGIAHFSVFFNWMEQTEHALLRTLGWSVVQPQEGYTLSWPRVQAACDYRQPVRFEQRVGIQLEVARLGRSSCTYRFRFQAPTALEPWLTGSSQESGVARPDSGWQDTEDWFAQAQQPMAEGTLTAVCCRIEAGRPHQSVEIPDELRQQLAQFSSSSG